MPQPIRAEVDPEFWERLRQVLRSYMAAAELTQKELAPRLGLDPTTLNNFLNRQSKTVGGLAVALACTLVDLVCDGTQIGRVAQSRNAPQQAGLSKKQLVLEFDEAFEFNRESGHPTMVLRKSVAHRESLRLSIRRIG